MLLEEGADPNLKVFNDIGDRRSQLRPVLVEYLASNETPSATIVNLLIKYGAKVVMKTQFRDPDGILNSLQNVVNSEADEIFYLLLDAAEAFDLCMIRRNSVLRPDQKNAVLDLASCPISLLRQVRFFLRRKLGRKLMETAHNFDLPKTLAKYLLFDYS